MPSSFTDCSHMSRGMSTALPWHPLLHPVPPLPVLYLALRKAFLPRAHHSARCPSPLQATLSPNLEASTIKGFHKHSGHSDCHHPHSAEWTP